MKKIILIILVSVIFFGTLAWIISKEMGTPVEYEVGQLTK